MNTADLASLVSLSLRMLARGELTRLDDEDLFGVQEAYLKGVCSAADLIRLSSLHSAAAVRLAFSMTAADEVERLARCDAARARAA